MFVEESLRHICCELAECYQARGQTQFRDRFLVLAAKAAHAEGDFHDAETFRLQLVAANPHHMLAAFPTFADALNSRDVAQYIEDLCENYGEEVASQLLHALKHQHSTSSHGAAVATPTPKPFATDILMGDEIVPAYYFPLSGGGIPPALPPVVAVSRSDTSLPQSAKTLPQVCLTSTDPNAGGLPPFASPEMRTNVRQPPAITRIEPGLPAGAWLPAFLFGLLVAGAVGVLLFLALAPFAG